MIPQPFDGGGSPFDSAVVVIFFATSHSLFLGGIVVPLDPTSADHQYISWEELGSLPFCNLIEIFLTDLVCAVGPIPDTFVFCPCNIVKQYTSSGDTTSLKPLYGAWLAGPKLKHIDMP
jgi:hypothetical protein